jgi:two-component system sporulation sensor kinase A
LGSSEKKYRQLVEISQDAIFVQQEGKFVYANNSALDLLGAKKLEEIQSHSFYDFFPRNYHKFIDKYIQVHDKDE